MANTERIKEAIRPLENWLNQDYYKPRKQGEKPTLKQNFTGCFEPTLQNIRTIRKELKEKHYETTPLEEDIAAFSKCTLAIDKLTVIPDFEAAYKKLDKLAYCVEDLIGTLQRASGKAEDKTQEKERDTTAVKPINIKNSNVIFGDVQAENVQAGNHASIQKYDGTEKKDFLKKLLGVLGAIVIAIIATLVVDILGRFGWFERIYNLLWPK